MVQNINFNGHKIRYYYQENSCLFNSKDIHNAANLVFDGSISKNSMDLADVAGLSVELFEFLVTKLPTTLEAEGRVRNDIDEEWSNL